MDEIALPVEFQQSCLNYSSYPQNLVLRGNHSYGAVLQSYKSRLDAVQKTLCFDSEEGVEVAIRDLSRYLGKDIQSAAPQRLRWPNTDHAELEKRNIHSSEWLTRWLGTSIKFEIHDGQKRTVVATKRDPQCRFIYIHAEHSRDKLKITRDMLAEILTYHQVMPAYLDFIFVFGSQIEASDLRFTGFHQQMMINDPPRTPSIPQLGRSSRSFQICYNLKGVKRKTHSADRRCDEWSIRQAAIHHQFDVVFGTTLWIVTKGRLDLKERFQGLTGVNGRPEDKSYGSPEECLKSSLSAHLMYCHWATEDWRWYICWLEQIFDTHSAMVVYGSHEPGHAYLQYKPHDIQELQRWKDTASEISVMLESNVAVITALQKFYLRLLDNNSFPAGLKEACGDDVRSFVAALDEIQARFHMERARSEHLKSLIHDRKEMVSQLFQAQAVDRTEELNRRLGNEAIITRIITVGTLIYLPAMFSSTLFSTDIIRYPQPSEDARDSEAFSSRGMIRWMEVTVPLTLFTLVFAWVSYKRAQQAHRNHSFPNPRPRKDGFGLFRWFRLNFSGISGTQETVLPLVESRKTSQASSSSVVSEIA